MLKKFFAIIIFGACITALNSFAMVDTCSAEISKSELSLGGVACSNLILRNDIERMYGKPDWKDQWDAEWRYGDSVSISFQEGVVSGVTSTANNGWATPTGLSVGMNVNTALKLYGDPDKSKTNGNKTLYIYFVNYLAGGEGHLGVVFDKYSKKISKLAIHKNRMADFREYYPNWEAYMFK